MPLSILYQINSMSSRLLRGVFLVLASAGFLVNAQTSRLSGKITNNKNEALSGVSIKIQGGNAGAISDVEGRYTLSLEVGKKYTISLTAVGYEPKTITDVEVLTGVTNELIS